MFGNQWAVTVKTAGGAERIVGPFVREPDTVRWITANRADDWASTHVIPLERPRYQYSAETKKAYVLGPYVKQEMSYLSSGAWDDDSSPYGYQMGEIAYYYRVQERYGGDRITIRAATTKERARAATEAFLVEEFYIEAEWLDVEQARALKDDAWRCPGCGRRWDEVPAEHDWSNGSTTCQWATKHALTKWWPDGTIRDEYWTPEATETADA